MTFYLNTGGGRRRDRVSQPQLGNAVLWKNYKVEKWMGLEWMVRDERAEHAGLPPKQGEKWLLDVKVKGDYWRWDMVRYYLKFLLLICIIIG